jgi:hypothetical protein
MDPIQGVAKLILGLWEGKKIQNWIVLLFELLFSGSIGFLLTCGSAFALHSPAIVGIGRGMIVAAVLMLAVYNSNPLTKGMRIVVPKLDDTEKAIAADTQTLQH